ncbi:hypothetical protein Athai_48450 [Actinocatenispora thailandica]|uniref:Uncharacterized protein n=1 Tax=Actinocatenispora thailandica TaxID=227318 RepID=A0A7R7HYJ2_9ACTN|nr:DUF6510 family protein [Actinocatenispora thailandica]BCJ37342.1 hypothetical protein Athai_48450 [Actinocatenispora thailandica]
MTDRLDGNAIAGTLRAVFGTEMTTAVGICGHCGASNPLGALDVYLAGPGTVARCPGCEAVLLVLVEVRGVTCVDALGFAELTPAA